MIPALAAIHTLPRVILSLSVMMWGAVLLIISTGHHVPRGTHLSYTSRPDSLVGNNAVDIMLYDVRHGLRVPMLHVPQEPQQLSWSTDGKHVAFYPSPSPHELVVYRPNRQDSQVFSFNDDITVDVTESLSWSSDNTRIAFLGYTGAVANDQIYIASTPLGELELALDGYGDLSQIQWSPTNADQLAFVSRTDEAIYLIDFRDANSPVVRLTTGTSYEWLPDGRGIVAFDPIGEIVVHQIGEPEVRVAVFNQPDGPLVWAPDANSYLYTSIQTTSFDVLHYSLTTGQLSTLAGWRTYEGQPAWSPDGRWVAYVATLNGHDNIMLFDTQRNARFRLLQLSARDWNPSWRPPSQ